MASRQTIIHRDDLQAVRPLIWHGQEVYSKYEQIVLVVGARLGDEAAQLFSRPVVPERQEVRSGQSEATWLADHVSSPRPLPELPDSEQEAYTARLGQLLEQVTALGEELKNAGKPDERELGEVLQLAVEVPGLEYVLVEQGRMVLVCWGFCAAEVDERERFRLTKALERPAAEEGTDEAPEPPRAATPPPPPPPQPESPANSGGSRRWRWIAAVLGGLLLLVLLGLLLFWWLRPELVPPEPGFQPADPDRFVDHEDEPLGRQIVDGQLLVLLEEGVDTRELLEAYARDWRDEGIRIAGYRPAVGMVQVEVDGELADAKAYLRGLPEVEEATLNPVDEIQRYEPDDPGFDTDTDGGSARDWGYHAINAFEAWEMTLGSGDVKVAVIDGDFDPDHPELAAPRISGFDVTTGEATLRPEAGHSHGIHVAATAIGEIDNDEGVAGVCPHCSGLLIEAAGGTWGFAQSNIIEAMELARDRGADVVNMSLGVGVPQGVDPEEVVRATRASERIYERLIASLEEQGTVVVGAAGNDNAPARVDPRNRQDDSFVVGAVEHGLAPTSFTNHGDVVDIAAPGKAIYSAVEGDEYEKKPGTSMASPFVAGAVGLMRSVNPDLSPAEVRALLVETAQPLEEDPDRPVGQLLDVAAAVEAAQADDGAALPRGACDCPELERRIEELERRVAELEDCCEKDPDDDPDDNGDDDRLVIPDDPDEDDLSFAEGVWRASEGLTRDRDDAEIEIEFRIRADGSGRITYDEPEGECPADLSVSLDGRTVFMEQQGLATCQHDRTSYEPYQFECEATADGTAWCSAQNMADPDRDVVRFFMEEQ